MPMCFPLQLGMMCARKTDYARGNNKAHFGLLWVLLRCILPLVLCPGRLRRLKLTVPTTECGLRRVLVGRCDRGVLYGERTSTVHCGKIQELVPCWWLWVWRYQAFFWNVWRQEAVDLLQEAKIIVVRAPPQYQAACHRGLLGPEVNPALC